MTEENLDRKYAKMEEIPFDLISQALQIFDLPIDADLIELRDKHKLKNICDMEWSAPEKNEAATILFWAEKKERTNKILRPEITVSGFIENVEEEFITNRLRLKLQSVSKEEKYNRVNYSYPYNILCLDSGNRFGYISINEPLARGYDHDISYGIDPAYRGNGYAPEALEAILRYLQDIEHTTTVIPTNDSSERVKQKTVESLIGSQM